jgi:predicted TIM-barrel fold metal-dependent hydrolase
LTQPDAERGEAAELLVDTHFHLYRTPEEAAANKDAYVVWEYGEREDVAFSDHVGNYEGGVAALESSGIRYAVVANLFDVGRAGVRPAEDLVAFNRWLCDLAQQDARFIPLIAVDPNILSIGENVAHVREMARDHGAAGIKLHPPLQRLNLSDDRLFPIFEACAALDLVVLSHTGPSREDIGIGEPGSLHFVLSSFPTLRVILAHMGGATWRQLPATAAEFPNVHFDLCEIVEWLGAPNAPTPTEMSALIREVGVERVMMGSDFPWYDPAHTIQQVGSLPGLTAVEQRGILGMNAVRFFRLPA